MEHEIITLFPPAREWIRPLLSMYSYWDEAHRSGIWADDLRSRLEGRGGQDAFFVALDGSVPVAALDLCRSRADPRVGCIHRVFTNPYYRHRGLAGRLLSRACEHFETGGGEWLMLNTGWDTSAHHLYREFGFQEMRRDPWSDGVLMGRTMTGDVMEEWREAYFEPVDRVRSVQLDGRHWAPLMLLCNGACSYLVHHYALGILGDWAVDGRLLSLFRVLESGKGFAVGLQTPRGVLVGFATVVPCLDLWQIASYQRHIRLVDVWLHSNYIQHTQRLLSDLLSWEYPLSDDVEHLMAYAESDRAELCQALEAESFQKVALLENHYKLEDDRTVDLTVYRRKLIVGLPASDPERGDV
jgi:GNAT superfamily N-acetyltransferase